MTVPQEKDLSIVRRYPLEFLVILLLGGFVFLYSKMESKQAEINEYMKTERPAMIEAMQQSTNAINNNTLIIQNFLNDSHRPKQDQRSSNGLGR